ncbi:uncharacterized protein K444DRAFT_92549 [Hyaloscypha bicolor E]|uniref:Uncharacterized protein n=1 Tax=Hyaloscypha bicolor E TaxID=1095630 RepID=A0A2J6SVR0_9HELO|nr:uncharacterized protein K444DRAFT_92549 [Hyaloscypha bicolor E]PMD54865.1 hypothetical protein K444DRAFT_92549 [Hyaloscypha bicolor E]
MHQRSDCRRLQCRTNVGGRFPIDSAKKAKPQPHEKAELFFVTDTFGEYGNSSPSSLAYRLDNTLGCASGEKICIGPTAMMQVLSLWVGLMQSIISRSFSGVKNLKTSISN